MNLSKPINKSYIDSQDEYGFPYDPEMTKHVVKKSGSSDYGYIPEIPRLYLRSHIFGGSHLRDERTTTIYNRGTKHIEERKIHTPKLQEKVFLEILNNAIDNAYESQDSGIPVPSLHVTMNGDTISLRSTGKPIPVDIHSYFYTQNQFGTVAELIFGVIGAGSNTDDTKAKQTGGQNGYGAKLTNCFARYFEAEIGDNVRGFHQKVIWRKNMMEKVSSVITPSKFTQVFNNEYDKHGIPVYHIVPVGERYTGENFVKITWKQDFRKFGTTGFSEEDLELYMRFVAEASLVGKFGKVTFNGEPLDCKSAEAYKNLLGKTIAKNSLIHHEFKSPPQISGKKLEDAISNLEIIPIVELILLDTPGSGTNTSYCNGICNPDGGVHTDAVYRELLEIVKDTFMTVKGFDKSIDLSKLTINDVKKNITIFISYKCLDPTFKGQDKEKLFKPTPKIKFSPEEITKLRKWSFISTIYNNLTGKLLKKMNDALGGSERIKNDLNFQEANWIGTKRQSECVLILCEGNSAGAYITKWIYATEEKQDKYACFLLKGKFKNITDYKNYGELLENVEIKKLITYMGFRTDVDYTTKAGFDTLKYPTIYIMVDADSDGSHIHSLLMNFIYRLYPTFLQAHRLFYVPTPVIRILNASGKTHKVFYDMSKYREYVKTETRKDFRHKYFKGLASGDDAFAAEDAKISPIVFLNFDQLSPIVFDTAFKKGLTNERKKWIKHWSSLIDTDVIQQMPGTNDSRRKCINISDYLNTKLVEYSIDTFSRALPSFKDGFKKSQRQLLWYLLTEWKFGHSKKNEAKLKAIATAAETKTEYAHGDLVETLSRMGSKYPGSNNIPLLVQDGQFGTRERLGKDIGAARYVHTKPDPIVKRLFSEELMKLIDRYIVNNEKVEPKWIPCKLPLHVINGFIGLATAYSTEHPSYHPLDIIIWIINYLDGKDCFPLVPWFKGFTGEISLEMLKNKYKKDKDLVLDTQEKLMYYEGLTMSTKGKYEILRERDQEFTEEVDGKKQKVIHKVKDILVTEIPIGVATRTYIHEMGKYCDKVDVKSDNTDTPTLILTGWTKNADDKDLKMVEKVGLCNISLIDDDGIPTQYRNIYEVLTIYIENMKSLYVDLKNTKLTNIDSKIIKENMTIKLINLLLNDEIKTKKQSETFISKQLEAHGIEYVYYKELGRRSESIEGYKEHIDKLAALEKERKIVYDRDYLDDWKNDLMELYKHFSNHPEYKKLKIHQYEFVHTSVKDLVSGKVKTPYPIKEEIIPQSI